MKIKLQTRKYLTKAKITVKQGVPFSKNPSKKSNKYLKFKSYVMP